MINPLLLVWTLLTLAVIAVVIMYLVYWGVEYQDCYDTYTAPFNNVTNAYPEYIDCLHYKGVPVFEDLKAPNIDFMPEPVRTDH